MDAKMYAVPYDGSEPFLMATLDYGDDPLKRAAYIWRETSHLYIKALRDYYVINYEGRIIGP